MILDDAIAIGKVDRSGTLALMERTPERFAPPSDSRATCGMDLERPLNVVFGGVGGSGIVGDILVDYSRESIEVPVSVCRTLKILRSVGKSTLFIAMSYSGETQETLHLLAQAKRSGAQIATIGSGGQIISQSRSEGVPYLKVTADLLPRIALPELLGAAVYVLERAGLITDSSGLLAEARRSLAVQIDKVKPTIPFDDNYAKQMAQALEDKIPLLIGGEESASVLRRFKNELNENSKMPAFYYTLPEAYHDDVEGFRSLRQLAHAQPVLLQGHDEVEGQRRTRERLLALLRDLSFPAVLPFEGIGQDRLSQLITAITFGDYVSVYLAVLKGVDPSELTLIPRFREAMRGG
jgi:glucose/mannose-6-phosphate isomerase